jgi:hypothetical protein
MAAKDSWGMVLAGLSVLSSPFLKVVVENKSHSAMLPYRCISRAAGFTFY